MKTLAFLAFSAVATAAMATGPSFHTFSGISISGTSSQTISVNGGLVKNTANDHTYANQNIASNKGAVDIQGNSTQSSTLRGATVTNEAVHNGDVAVQNLASNVGNVVVDRSVSFFPYTIKVGNSTQTANVTNSSVTNKASGDEGCRDFDCRDAALAYQNVSSNMGDINISGTSNQTTNISGGSTLRNKADGAQTVAVQNVASNYGSVNISGSSTQTASISSHAVVANLALGTKAHAVQNLASNDSCDPPPVVCVGPACGPYAGDK